ncbi:hypothetical protein [uncultured Winogradskyella sp.]|uniref:hypothetical protein n=1 Tax=uncultured Winogradskyella sp. TaxID=395353 RepID=UPI00261EDFE6|nr:hypothetical protein [uncultured Winogradskyella sp.]
MSTIAAQYIDQLTMVKKELPKVARQILKESENEIILLLQETQLAKGLDAEGNLTGTYSRATEIISLFEKPTPRKPKREGEPFNYEATGEFFDTMKLLFKDAMTYDIFTPEYKAKELNEYLPNLDLSKENNEIINQKILMPKLIEWVLSKIKL